MMHKFSNFFRDGSGRQVFFILLGLVLMSGIFASCAQHIKPTMYQIDFNIEEFTPPQSISDPEVRKAFDEIISVFEKANLGMQSWTVDIVNDRFDAEDKNAENRYNNTLTKVKACEAECKRIIDALDAQSESSLYLKVVCKLSRWVAADSQSSVMKEYRFELQFNRL